MQDVNPYLGVLTKVPCGDDEVELGYCYGRFNNWCILCRYKGHQIYYHDAWYFKNFIDLFDELGPQVFKAFLVVYAAVNSKHDMPRKPAFVLIDLISSNASSSKYFQEELEFVLKILYLSMIAEVHYYPHGGNYRSWLGKKVKLVGICQMVFDGFTPVQAANWSKGKSAYEIEDAFDYYNEIINNKLDRTY